MHIQTYIDQPGSIPPEALLVCLGAPAAKPAGRVLLFTNLAEKDLLRAQTVRPEELKDGLHFLISREAYRENKVVADRIQRHLAWLFCKFVHYPRNANIPDPCGLYGPKPPNILNEINRCRNAPLLLRSPLTDALARARIRQPLLLVLPGPSLRGLAPRLKALSRVCLVACIARTMDFCLGNGVEPDFLVQLDTGWWQTLFLPPERNLPGCTLVALSLAPVHAVAERFRGVFFMDSFDREVLPNPSRLRESWLSSLLPCLGLAEALAAPLVLVAGADLSFGPNGQYHGDGPAAPLPAYPPDSPILVGLNDFTVPDVHGRAATTRLPYFASAHEATLFAREISRGNGARFCNITGEGILDPTFFPLPEEDFSATLPAVDRAAVLAKVDAALSSPESVQLLKHKMKLLRDLEMVRDNLDFLNFCRWRKQDAEAAAHPMVRALHAQGDYLAQTAGLSQGERLELAVELLEQWRLSLFQARNVCQLEQERARGGLVPVLCLEDENPIEDLERRHPGLRARPVRIWRETAPAPDADRLPYRQFAAWSRERKVFLVTPRAERHFQMLLDCLPGKNWLVLR